MSEERSEAAEATRESAALSLPPAYPFRSAIALSSTRETCTALHAPPRGVGMPRRSRVLTAFRGLSALHRHFSERQVRIAFRSGSGKRTQDATQCSQLVLSKEELR